MRIIVLVLLTVSAQSLLHSPLLRRFGPLDVGKRSSSSAIFNFQGVQFYGEITVGTPGQKIPALFDTGSYDTWMPATSYCSTISCHSGGYQSGDSSTSAVTTDPFEVLYLSSSVSGNYVKDTISIGSLHSVQPIAMGVVQGKSGFPSQHAFDGLVGMGPNSSVLHSLLDLAVSDATGERRMFSMYLSDDTSGSLTLGGYDETHLAGDNSSQLVWLESYSTNSAWALPYWILPSAAIEFGGEKLSSAAVVVDSGSSFIIGPQKDVQRIYALAEFVDYDSGAIECWRVKSLPNIVVTIQGHRFELRPEQYCYRGTDKFTCYIGISPNNDALWILGDTFMVNYLSVFSFEDPNTPKDASRPATLSRAVGNREVRHWIGLGPVSPARTDDFPAPTWFNSILFFRIVVIAIVCVIGFAFVFVGRLLIRRFRR